MTFTLRKLTNIITSCVMFLVSIFSLVIGIQLFGIGQTAIGGVIRLIQFLCIVGVGILYLISMNKEVAEKTKDCRFLQHLINHVENYYLLLLALPLIGDSMSSIIYVSYVSDAVLNLSYNFASEIITMILGVAAVVLSILLLIDRLECVAKSVVKICLEVALFIGFIVHIIFFRNGVLIAELIFVILLIIFLAVMTILELTNIVNLDNAIKFSVVKVESTTTENSNKVEEQKEDKTSEVAEIEVKEETSKPVEPEIVEEKKEDSDK